MRCRRPVSKITSGKAWKIASGKARLGKLLLARLQKLLLARLGKLLMAWGRVGQFYNKMFSLWVSLILQSCENERGVMLCEFYKAFSEKSKLYVARRVGWGGRTVLS